MEEEKKAEEKKPYDVDAAIKLIETAIEACEEHMAYSKQRKAAPDELTERMATILANVGTNLSEDETETQNSNFLLLGYMMSRDDAASQFAPAVIKLRSLLGPLREILTDLMKRKLG